MVEQTIASASISGFAMSHVSDEPGSMAALAISKDP
eukprot:CAMPEP_0195106130 /NCGR_PEP_ID=MMETSP0448-20130528/79354_1 /TAXON_ID=66468 /ORGANISM="Heterocapsa triquestra, Strain CCMP 448" /LENGTH=35 /DNA_ID= /DNA_START= /DNA_END= /DNA_ORIENTATION=